MHKLIRVFLVIYFIPVLAIAQNKYVQVTSFGYANDDATNVIFRIDDAGNAYVVMSSRNAINFKGQQFQPTSTSDYVIVGKLNAAGNLMWARPLTNGGYAQVYDLQIDKDHNVYLSGIGSQIKMDDGTTLSSGTFLLKLDKAGKTVWGVATNDNASMHEAGPIALADDGSIYWSGCFFGILQLQGSTLNSHNTDRNAPQAYVAKVSANGQVTAIYHDPGLTSVPKALVPASNGNAALMVSRDPIKRYKVVLDKNLILLSDKQTISYGDYVHTQIRPVTGGYRLQTYLYDPNSATPSQLGYYDMHFDQDLEVTGATQLFPPASGNSMDIFDGIGYTDNSCFFTNRTAQGITDYYQLDWSYFDGTTKTTLPSEPKGTNNNNVYGRDFVKVVGDTLNMVLRHYDTGTQGFDLYGQHYNTPNNLNESYFWVKYIYEDPAKHKYTITYTPSITEGGAAGNITVSLPPGITASSDIRLTYVPDQSNYLATAGADYTPIAITLPAGANSVTFSVSAFIDNLLEGDEYISGILQGGAIGPETYTTDNNKIRITIIDHENTFAGRVIDITPGLDVLNEGSRNTYYFNAINGVKLQYPINITMAQGKWVSYVGSTLGELTMDDNSPNRISFLIDYPDDNIIRSNQMISLLPSADDAHYGAFRFQWKGTIITEMDINVIDNDAATGGMQVAPTTLKIREGHGDHLTFKLQGNNVFEDDLNVSYTWGGNNITSEDRITTKAGSFIFAKKQNQQTFDINIGNNKLIDTDNERTITFTALDSKGQEVNISPQKTVAVDIIDDDKALLVIPNTFTPNGDGINDTWRLPDTAFDHNTKVNIFDRFGAVLFSSVGYAIPWDGTSKGKPVPAGTYYYMIIDPGQTLSGSVTVIR